MREEKKYQAILIDPPWHFKTFSGKTSIPHRGAHQHYKTMKDDEIIALPVGDFAAKDCALFLWVVDSHLEVAFKCFPAWGFKFKTRAFTWNKRSIGMGYWTRKQTEMCLLATKGKPKRLSKGVPEIIDEKRREHSRKPDETYNRIEALVAGPYLEFFARQTPVGWDVCGNEVNKFNAAIQKNLRLSKSGYG